MMTNALPSCLFVTIGSLPDALQKHMQRVRIEAQKLALSHGLEESRVDFAAATHDICRSMKPGDLLLEARYRGLKINRIDEQNPILLHGPVGAARLRDEFGISDLDIIEAVHWHTTAAPDLPPLGKAVFLADKLDPLKEGRYPFLEEVRGIAQESLDQGVVTFLQRDIQRLLRLGHAPHPIAMATLNGLLR
ncbi:MAG: HD domain-containing protein [SAR202 cluster bacterium]|nr:HD domain-containing protein [SAR202 cluster bacterium]